MFEKFSNSCNNSQERIKNFKMISDSFSRNKSKNLNELKEFTEEQRENLIEQLEKNIGIIKYKRTSSRNKKICQVSNHLLGETSEFIQVLLIEASGDGNCLFNSVSLLLYGNQGFSIELRMRAIFHMILNYESYLDPSNYQSVEFFNFVFSTTSDKTGETLEETFFNEVQRVPQIGEFTGLLIMVAVCNSLEISIKQIYPKVSGSKTQIEKFCNMSLSPFAKNIQRNNFILSLEKNQS